MEHSPSVPLDLEALAEQAGELRGRLDAGAFDARLAAALDVDEARGEVVYALDFRRLSADAIGVSGTLHARLAARCQRCLEVFELESEISPQLLIPLAEGAETPPDWEHAEFDAPPTLAGLIEEELLLALPFAPRHPVGECPAEATVPAAPEPAGRRPFAGLADALAARNGRDRH
ncbi:MAG: YceD family protein [Gammaproteobacteria bacterium]